MIENKKRYVKPGFLMMQFNLSDNIAATGCTSSSSSTTTYESQLIQCIIDGEEYVFYSGCSNNVTSGYIGNYNGTTYFLWYDGKVGTKPDDDDVATLEAIKSALGATSALGQSGWHAGPTTATITTIFNSSY